MRRIVPSDIVEAIDRLFNRPADGSQQHPRMDQQIVLGSGQNEQNLRIVLELIELLSDELHPKDYLRWVQNVRMLQFTVGRGAATLDTVHGEKVNPLAVIYEMLLECHDTVPAQNTSQLSFIRNEEFRETLRSDLSAVNHALQNQEWKAATVLAGSLIEAFLLATLQELPASEIERAVKANMGPNADLTSRTWTLTHYLKAAAFLNAIRQETKIAGDLAKDFRDLIHPSRGIRENASCTRGTAFLAAGAVFQVISDLSARPSPFKSVP